MNGNNKNLSQIKKNESKKFLSKKMKNNNFVFFIVIAVFYLIGNLLWYKFNNPIVVDFLNNSCSAKNNFVDKLSFSLFIFPIEDSIFSSNCNN